MKQFILVNGFKYYKRPYFKKIHPEIPAKILYNFLYVKKLEEYFIRYKDKIYVREDFKPNIKRKEF